MANKLFSYRWDMGKKSESSIVQWIHGMNLDNSKNIYTYRTTLFDPTDRDDKLPVLTLHKFINVEVLSPMNNYWRQLIQSSFW